MSISAEDAIKALVATDEKVQAHKDYHPDLPEALVAVAGYGTNEEWKAWAEERVNKGGKRQGRSGSATKGATSPATENFSGGSSAYTRPNGELYFPRMWGDHEDVGVLRKARELMQFPLLYGAPGCGKTALVEGAFGDNLFTVLGSADTTLADFVGSWIAKPDGGYEWMDGPLVRAMESGGVLLIDEIGLVDPKELSGLYGTMDGRREIAVTANPARGTVKAVDGFFVVGATNPNAPGVRLSEALLSRFVIQVEMTTDWQLARKMGVPPKIINFAQNASRNWESGTVSWAPQFRELLAYRDLAKTFGEKFAQQNLLALAPAMDREFLTDLFQRAIGDGDIARARI